MKYELIAEGDLIEMVRTLAAESPDRVATCEYAVGGKPECIIGHALAAEGWSVEALGEEIRSAWALCRSGTIPGVGKADAQWLQRVQTFQDSGLTWAEAVERADMERDVAGRKGWR